ncbi:MAG: MBOAT family O-acyltransferase [Isosphaeraceae bacterium]
MNVCSIAFIVFSGVLAIFWQLVPGKRWRQISLSVVNVAFLAPFVPNRRSWVCLALFILATYAAIRLARSRPSRRLAYLVLGAAIASFVFVKRYTFLEWVLPAALLDHAVVVVGLSYMLFKFIHVFVDMQQGQIESFSLASYANYQLAFFTLLAGPIQRFNDFHRSWAEIDPEPDDQRETWLCWNRLLLGLLQMGALAPLAWELFDRAAWRLDQQPVNNSLWWFAVYLYAYPVYLYLNFAGYTDVVLGSARLLGFRLPENFNRPYLARNIPDFWNRWHMTLTHWIRDYVFMTSYKSAAERLPNWSKISGYMLLFMSLTVAGVWHGSTGGFAVFGLLQGLGALVSQVYGDGLKSLLGRPGFQRYLRNRALECAAIVVTFNFVCFTLLFFSSGASGAVGILGAVGSHWGASGWASAPFSGRLMPVMLAVSPLFILCVLWRKEAIFALLYRIGQRLTQSARPLRGVVIAETVLVVFLLVFFWAFNQKDPVVVYLRF